MVDYSSLSKPYKLFSCHSRNSSLVYIYIYIFLINTRNSHLIKDERKRERLVIKNLIPVFVPVALAFAIFLFGTYGLEEIKDEVKGTKNTEVKQV